MARQWCGRLGKVENCQIGIYVVLAGGDDRARARHRDRLRLRVLAVRDRPLQRVGHVRDVLRRHAEEAVARRNMVCVRRARRGDAETDALRGHGDGPIRHRPAAGILERPADASGADPRLARLAYRPVSPVSPLQSATASDSAKSSEHARFQLWSRIAIVSPPRPTRSRLRGMRFASVGVHGLARRDAGRSAVSGRGTVQSVCARFHATGFRSLRGDC